MKPFVTLAVLALAAYAHGEAAPKNASKSPPEKAKETEIVKEGPSTEGPPVAAVSSIEAEDIDGFQYYAPQIQELIRKSLALTKLNLTYTFGSSDPKNGGMDCSGTIYHVLHDFGFKDVPRQSNEMAGWVKDKTLLHRVNEADALTHPEFSALQPGNLLFWSGTYTTAPRKIPVTHVMLYLGKLKKSGTHVVFGASDGRAYQGKRRTGVSVFDFSLPKSTSSATFYGYGMIPGVGKIEAPEPPVVAAAKTEASPAVKILAETKSETKPEPPKTAAPGQSEPMPVKPADAKPKPEPKSASSKTVTETKSPSPPKSETEGEEVRSAIRLDQKSEEVASSAKMDPDKKVGSDKTTAAAKTDKVASTPAKASTSTKSSTSKSKTVTQQKTSPAKSTSVAKRKPAPPPPGPLDRAKRAAGSFVDNVRDAVSR